MGSTAWSPGPYAQHVPGLSGLFPAGGERERVDSHRAAAIQKDASLAFVQLEDAERSANQEWGDVASSSAPPTLRGLSAPHGQHLHGQPGQSASVRERRALRRRARGSGLASYHGNFTAWVFRFSAMNSEGRKRERKVNSL